MYRPNLNLKQKFIFVAIAVFLTLFALPSVAGTNSEQARYRIERESARVDFASNESPSFTIRFARERTGFDRLGAWAKHFFTDEYRGSTASARLVDQDGGIVETAANVSYDEQGLFQVALSNPETKIRPGTYGIEFTVMSPDGTAVVETQYFTWGLLALNYDKAPYKPGETAVLTLGVLDAKGNTVCNAVLTLTMTGPNGEETKLSTADGTINRNPACGLNNVINEPDYSATYPVDDAGDYRYELTAMSAEGARSIEGSFSAEEAPRFQIERQGPTRIQPAAEYGMTVRVIAGEDFAGDIAEMVPAEFSISDFRFPIFD